MNAGLSVAKFPYLQILSGPHVQPFVTPDVFMLSKPTMIDSWWAVSGGVDILIHPGHKLPAARGRITYKDNGRGQFTISESWADKIETWFDIRGGCEAANQRDKQIKLSQYRIAHLLQSDQLYLFSAE